MTVDLKLVYQTPTLGDAGFQKPWFMVFVMFLGMSLSLPLYALQNALRPPSGLTAASAAAKQPLLPAGQPRAPAPPAGGAGGSRIVRTALKGAFPACCDLLATGLQSAGLLYVSASVFSIFRGSSILVTALLRSRTRG